MKAVIIGDSPSGVIDFDTQQCESYGLNAASIKYNTKYSFTGHEHWLREYRRLGFTNIISGIPTFERSDPGECMDYIKQNAGWSIERMEEQSIGTITMVIKAAIDKEDIFYPNYWSVVHLCIYYLLRKGFTEIDLVKCHLDYDKYEDGTKEHEHTPDQLSERIPYMRENLQKMIDAAEIYGIKINWIK